MRSITQVKYSSGQSLTLLNFPLCYQLFSTIVLLKLTYITDQIQQLLSHLGVFVRECVLCIWFFFCACERVGEWERERFPRKGSLSRNIHPMRSASTILRSNGISWNCAASCCSPRDKLTETNPLIVASPFVNPVSTVRWIGFAVSLEKNSWIRALPPVTPNPVENLHSFKTQAVNLAELHWYQTVIYEFAFPI